MDFEYRSTKYEHQDVSVPIPTYPYRPCNASNHEFRLLEILPQSSPADQELKCRLHHYKLDDHPTFIALSYECGDPSLYRCITVDDNGFPVGLNLYHALHQLRVRKCPLVWVDAICIHQSDMTEKSEHILMMKDIYHFASNVAAWLGEEDFGSEKVMRMLNAIDQSRDPDRSGGQAPWLPNWQQLQDLKSELVAFLGGRTYWQRAWIVQEIAMGSGVVLFCGERSVRWRGLEELVTLIVSLNAFPDTNMRYVDHLCRMRSNRINGIPVGLLEALCGGSDLKASMFQDRVYALLGLVFDQAAFVRRVDYTLSSNNICTELTKSWILAYKSLDIMLAAGANNGTDQVQGPSWMPNYLSMRNSHILRRLSSYTAGQDRRYRCGQMSPKWSASGSTVVGKNDWRIINQHQLDVRGICIGTVNGLGAVLSDDREPVDGPNAMWKNERSEEELEETICGSLALYEQEYEDFMDKQNFLEFLFNFDSIVYGFWKSKDLKARFNKVVEWRERNASFNIRGRRLSQWAMTFSSTLNLVDAWMTIPRLANLTRPTAQLLQGSSGTSTANRRARERRKRDEKNPWAGLQKKHKDTDMMASLHTFADLVDEGLRLMITDFGDMGWVHPAAEIGDLIVLLKGCSVPVVLRPIHAIEGTIPVNTVVTYRLIGHAYGHGVMWGEAWSTVREQDLTRIVIQ